MKLTCRQMARLTLEPKAVLTARGDRPRSLKSLEKDWVRERRGRSSAITTQLRTHDRFRPRAYEVSQLILARESDTIYNHKSVVIIVGTEISEHNKREIQLQGIPAIPGKSPSIDPVSPSESPSECPGLWCRAP